ncbi:IclR family transcriptional regulator [Isoptericola hypogeus]|uniref:IclR family transcriptional regulator n=2 Tax=Isoptericola hypogeus TaxID=300179 RepID=A0ABN2JGR7_9MICO
MTDHPSVPSASPNALANGLRVLQLLVDADAPLSATEIARRVGLHQSSASRILATLADAGFARKTGPRSFAPDFGVLSLGAAAVDKFDLAHRPRAAMQAVADRAVGHTVALSILWRDQVIYFLRSSSRTEPRLFDAEGWPLHLSAPGMRLLLDLPEGDALTLLDKSRQRFGWAEPGPAAPGSAREALDQARAALDHDCLLLDDWQAPGQRAAAITVDLPGHAPVALSVAGRSDLLDPDTVRLVLHAGRRDVEAAMNQQSH